MRWEEQEGNWKRNRWIELEARGGKKEQKQKVRPGRNKGGSESKSEYKEEFRVKGG